MAARAAVPLVDLQLVCSDAAGHRRPVEQRAAIIARRVLPDWDAVRRRVRGPRADAHAVLDTAGRCLALVEAALGAAGSRLIRAFGGSRSGAGPG